MDSQSLKSQFDIEWEQPVKIGRYNGVYSQGVLYIMVPIQNWEETELVELYKMSNHLYAHGDQTVARFKQARNGSFIGKYQEEPYVVLYNEHLRVFNTSKMGRKLAKFHHRGRLFEERVEHISRIGQWKELWEKRLDQMEKVYHGKVFSQPDDEFDLEFIHSFPYFMALAENAIQYLVDTELDDDPTDVDAGTVCYRKFSISNWGGEVFIKNPFDWTFDHAGRDLSEWTREHYWNQRRTYETGVHQFFQEYQSINVLSSFSWRLTYARLIFPLHYFECIEDYYLANSEHNRKLQEEKLQAILRGTQDYELFLARFYELAEAPVRTLKIPSLGWV
ncbi:spore coat protein CotS [Bacillus carboniphilus]|uniref:Spore coat protein CotS n=1 Tax=Bacillus carboniphilus TaxID=86663 RepID=A0ABP3FXQ9_9BACI